MQNLILSGKAISISCKNFKLNQLLSCNYQIFFIELFIDIDCIITNALHNFADLTLLVSFSLSQIYPSLRKYNGIIFEFFNMCVLLTYIYENVFEIKIFISLQKFLFQGCKMDHILANASNLYARLTVRCQGFTGQERPVLAISGQQLMRCV